MCGVYTKNRPRAVLAFVRPGRIGHESQSILVRFAPNLLSVLELYEFCTPCRYFLASAQNITGKVL